MNSARRREEKKTISRAFDEQEFTNIRKEYTINMAWHNVTNSDANNSVLQRIAESKGLTTIAPTWFHVKDTDGNMDSIASADYVNYAVLSLILKCGRRSVTLTEGSIHMRNLWRC